MIVNPVCSVHFSPEGSGTAFINFLGETGEQVDITFTNADNLFINAEGLRNVATLLEQLAEVGWEDFCDINDFEQGDAPGLTSESLWDSFNDDG